MLSFDDDDGGVREGEGGKGEGEGEDILILPSQPGKTNERRFFVVFVFVVVREELSSPDGLLPCLSLCACVRVFFFPHDDTGASILSLSLSLSLSPMR